MGETEVGIFWTHRKDKVCVTIHNEVPVAQPDRATDS
ncbi:MAG: hypothetical protein HW380_3164 [Magnetococcales bacterium]|nr:hypothetical protein [Magnetococcales bacterium]